MKKAEYITAIKGYTDQMSSLILKSEAKIIETPDQIELLRLDLIKPGYKYLKDIHDGPYETVRRIWMLLPEALWNRYFAWGDFEDHAECVLLKNGLDCLKKALRIGKRPDIFKKGKVIDEIRRITKSKTKESGKTDSEHSKST